MRIERVTNFLGYLATASRAIGVPATLKWLYGTAQLNLKIDWPSVLSVQPLCLRYPVKLRARTSDPFVFRQIMIENEYRPIKDLRVATIIDLGANVGLASAWMLSNFPEASVFSVEAATDNFACCRDNLTPYGDRARVLHGAAWSSRTDLALHPQVCAADNKVETISAGDAGAVFVKGYDLASLIEMSGFEQVDLLKIDIEGAESEVFGVEVSKWLGRVHNLCIELHGQQCRDIFFEALAAYDYEHMVSGELDVCTNLRPKIAA